MALIVLSKQGIVTGTVVGLANLLIAIWQILSVKRMLPHGEGSNWYDNAFLVKDVQILVVVLIASLLSFLMILGIVKKRIMLVATWLVVAWLIAGYVSFTLLYHSLNTDKIVFDNFLFALIVTGGSIIALHPICQLLLEMHRGNPTIQGYHGWK